MATIDDDDSNAQIHPDDDGASEAGTNTFFFKKGQIITLRKRVTTAYVRVATTSKNAKYIQKYNLVAKV
jgi:hypothetical protein